MEAGSCHRALQRWYYDSNEGKCFQFTYSGCRGNRNRFMTELQCMTQCLQPAQSRIGAPTEGEDMLHKLVTYLPVWHAPDTGWLLVSDY